MYSEGEIGCETMTNDDLRLDILPTEIIMRICSYLEAEFIIRSIILVCKKFYKIFKDDYVWKDRLSHNWNYYPHSGTFSTFDLRKICVSLEKEYSVWKDNGIRMMKHNLLEAHIGFIDSVHLIQEGETCISGGRDCTLRFWDFAKLEDDCLFKTKDLLKYTVNRAHEGWIWSISSFDHVLCTGGWDTCLNLWDLQEECKLNSSVKCAGAVLCTDMKENLIAGGTYFRDVVLFDRRQGTHPVMKHTLHGRCVLALKMDSNYIITASEDKKLIIYDKRIQKPLKIFKCDDYLMSLSYKDGYIFGGDRRGLLHQWNSKADEFTFINSYDIGHKAGIKGLEHTLGCIISGSADKSVCVSTISPSPTNWACIKTAGEIGDLHYINNILVYSYGNDAIAVCKPKHS